jgi:hypothetical protein
MRSVNVTGEEQDKPDERVYDDAIDLDQYG